MPDFTNGRTLRERLLSRLIIDPSGCLLWTGGTRNGYGRIKIGGRDYPVHRLMYEMFVGPIPEGFVLDHSVALGCRNRNCAAPSHLEPVTDRVNNMRSTSPSAINATKTHCAKGHEFDLLNTRFTPSGRRACRICTHGFTAKHRARKRAEAPTTCGCGCGAQPRNPGSRFLPGHVNRRRELTSIERTEAPS